MLSEELTLAGMPRRKLDVFVRLAVDLADLSRCSRRRVGCVVVDRAMTEVLAIGYNGPASGLSNDSCRGGEGSCGCVHAEANALVKLQTRQSGLVLVTTCSPCEHCAGLVANCKRVSVVVYVEAYRDQAGVELLKRLGTNVFRVDVETKTPRG